METIFNHSNELFSAKGTVYGWGSNANGQLVADKYETSVYVDPTPLKVPFFVTYISSNYYRSAFITGTYLLQNRFSTTVLNTALIILIC